MSLNYLTMIWDVKIYLAKIKDSKGKDYNSTGKKKLPTKTTPNSGVKPIQSPPSS